MKRITVKKGRFTGRRIRIYCECDKGHKWVTTPWNTKPNCVEYPQCSKCGKFPWTYSKV